MGKGDEVLVTLEEPIHFNNAHLDLPSLHSFILYGLFAKTQTKTLELDVLFFCKILKKWHFEVDVIANMCQDLHVGWKIHNRNIAHGRLLHAP